MEWRRRLVHASGTALPAAYLVGVLTWRQHAVLWTAALVVGLALEALRLVVGLDWWVYRELTREYERGNPAGYALYLVGATAVALVFRPSVAVPAILMLTVADPLSGLLAERERRPAKRPFVLATTFGVSVFLAAWFVPPVPAVLGGLAATVADGVKPTVAGYVLDDNVTIPVGAAVAMAVGLRLVG